jgi:hypothetical protein
MNIASGTGIVSGTPTSTGNYSFTITANGGTGITASQSFTVTVTVAPAATLSYPASLSTMPLTTMLDVYRAIVPTFTGSVGTTTYSVISGSLPPGLVFANNAMSNVYDKYIGYYAQVVPGSIYANPSPTAAGTYTYTIQATDSQNTTATVQVTTVVQ